MPPSQEQNIWVFFAIDEDFRFIIQQKGKIFSQNFLLQFGDTLTFLKVLVFWLRAGIRFSQTYGHCPPSSPGHRVSSPSLLGLAWGLWPAGPRTEPKSLTTLKAFSFPWVGHQSKSLPPLLAFGIWCPPFRDKFCVHNKCNLLSIEVKCLQTNETNLTSMHHNDNTVTKKHLNKLKTM